jgi:hypothetical protein
MASVDKDRGLGAQIDEDLKGMHLSGLLLAFDLFPNLGNIPY